MVQPKKPPVSVRVPDDTIAAVHQYAAKRGIPRNAAYVELLQRGLKAATGAGVPLNGARKPPQKAVDAANAEIKRALADAPKVDLPLAGTFERRPYQKGGKS